jgi:hypothetical protein
MLRKRRAVARNCADLLKILKYTDDSSEEEASSSYDENKELLQKEYDKFVSVVLQRENPVSLKEDAPIEDVFRVIKSTFRIKDCPSMNETKQLLLSVYPLIKYKQVKANEEQH